MAVRIAVLAKGSAAKMDRVRLEVTWRSGRAFTLDVETHAIEGVSVRVYNPAKPEALRDCLRQRKATVGEIWRCAKICRMANAMRPSMEAITA